MAAPVQTSSKKKKRTSVVYDYYEEISENVFKCKNCKEIKKKSSTTNLWAHHYTHQAESNPEDMQAKQILMESRIADLFFVHRLPFRLVESIEFKMLIKAAFPEFRYVARRKLTNIMLPQKVDEVMGPLLEGAREAQYIAITTDECSRIVGSKFLTLLSLSVHYFDSDWNYKEVVVATKQLKGPKNAKTISSKITEICEENRIVPTSACTDSAAVMGKVMNNLNLMNVFCVAHRIHLCVKTAVTKTTKVFTIIRKCRRIAKFLNKSSNGRDFLTERMEEHGLDVKSIKSDTRNRWNSSFFMLVSVYEAISAVNELGAQHKMPTFSQVEIRLMKEIIVVLEICLHATNRVCRRTSTASIIIPIMSSVIMRIDSVIAKEKLKCDSKLFANLLVAELTRRRKQYLYERPELLYMCLLDCRWAYHSLVFMSDSKSDKKWSKVETDFLEEYEDQDMRYERVQEEEAVEKIGPVEKVDSFWGSYDTGTSAEGAKATLGDELEKYKALIKGRPRGDPDTVLPFELWREYEKEFPILSRLANRMLVVPATSTTSERIFSVVANITQNRQRNPMGVDNTERTVLITSNQRGGLREDKLLLPRSKFLKKNNDDSDKESESGRSSDSDDSTSEVETGIEEGPDSEEDDDNIDSDDGGDGSFASSGDSEDDFMETGVSVKSKRRYTISRSSPSKKSKK